MNIDLAWNREFAKVREGEVRMDNGNHKLYKCPADHWTIGWGWNIESRGLPDNIIAEIIRSGKNHEYGLDDNFACGMIYDIRSHGLTDSVAVKLLDIALTESQLECSSNIDGWDKCNFARKSVLIDMTYNMGWSTLSKFKKMLAAIARGDWEEAAAQMKDSSWYRQVGIRARVLEKMMITGEYP